LYFYVQKGSGKITLLVTFTIFAFMKAAHIFRFISLTVFSAVFFMSCRHDPDSEIIPLFPTKPYVEKDIPFAVADDTSGNPVQLLLDLYFPAKLTARQKFPLVVMMHPGSYLLFNKDGMAEYSQILADSGFIVASINYRLGWRENGGCDGLVNTLEEAEYRGIQDANAALRFLVAHAQQYAIDPDWIFSSGVSAGGAIALNSGFASDTAMIRLKPEIYLKLGGLNNIGNYYLNNVRVSGICSISGAISDSNFIQTSNAIPTICFHGTNDELVPFNTGYFLGCYKVPAFGSLCVYRRLVASHSNCVLYQKTDGPHLPWEYRAEICMPATAVFFHKVMTGNVQSAIYAE